MTKGERLRELRRRMGLPTDILARLARCSQRTIQVYERWGLPPRRRDTRERIARVLNVDPDWLFGEAESEPETEEVDS